MIILTSKDSTGFLKKTKKTPQDYLKKEKKKTP